MTMNICKKLRVCKQFPNTTEVKHDEVNKFSQRYFTSRCNFTLTSSHKPSISLCSEFGPNLLAKLANSLETLFFMHLSSLEYLLFTLLRKSFSFKITKFVNTEDCGTEMFLKMVS